MKFQREQSLEVYSTAGCPIDLEREAFDSTLLRLVEEEGVDPEEVQAEKRESLKMLGLLQSFLTNPALSREQKAEVCSSLLTKLEALMVTPKSEYLAHLIFPTQITQITELYEWLSLTNKQTNKL